MSTLLPFLIISETCEKADIWVRESLSRAGLRVVPTFDLQVARLAHSDCSCPHHGTEQCSCQLMVLLIYGKQEEPATLILHGQDEKTWISFSTPIEARSHPSLEASVRKLLVLHQVDLSVADD
jgi:hypothetical protein